MNFSSDSMPSKIIDIFSSPGQSAIRITQNIYNTEQTKWITTFYLVRTRKEKKSRRVNRKKIKSYIRRCV